MLSDASFGTSTMSHLVTQSCKYVWSLVSNSRQVCVTSIVSVPFHLRYSLVKQLLLCKCRMCYIQLMWPYSGRALGGLMNPWSSTGWEAYKKDPALQTLSGGDWSQLTTWRMAKSEGVAAHKLATETKKHSEAHRSRPEWSGGAVAWWPRFYGVVDYRQWEPGVPPL